MQLHSPESLSIEELKKENSDLRTKLNNLRESLVKSEERYRNLVESANSIILRIDTQGIIKFANNYTLRFFGYSCKEMVGKHINLILPSKEFSERDYTSLFEQVLSEPTKYVMVENQNIRKNGELIWISWTNRAIRNADGNIKEILSIGNDITQRKKTEDALKVEHDIREAVINNIGIGFVVADIKGNILSLNKAALRIHDFRNEEDRLSRLDQYTEEFELEYPDGNKVSLDQWPLAKALRGEFIRDFKVRLIRHISEDSRIIIYNTVPIYNTDNKQSLIILTLTDVTDIHRQNEALRESERRYFSLFNNTTLGIAHCKTITDNDGNPLDYRIIEVNDAYSTITGIKKEDIEGKTAREKFPDIGNFDFDYVGEYGKIAEKGGELNFEAFFEPLNQWLSIYVYSPGKGEFTAMFTDISVRKKMEEELRVNEAAMEAFFDSSPGILNLLDQDLRFIKTDKLTPTYFGLNRKSIIGRSVHELNPLFAENSLTPVLKKINESGEPILNTLVEGPIPEKHGETGYWLVSYFKVPLPGGNWGLGAMGVDVTETKKVEKTLALERELFEGIFNNIPVMITIYDPEMKNFRFNNEYINILGWTEEDATDGKLMEKIYPDPAYRESVTRYMQSLEPGWKEWRVTAKDGSIVDSSWANIHLTSGIFIGIGIDIRQRKLVEDKLRENEERLQIIFNNAAIGIVEVDYDDRFINVNNRICEILGYRREELIGKTVSDITAPEHLSHSNDLNFKIHTGEHNIISYEKQYIKSDGSLLWVHVTVSGIYDANGHHLKSIGTVEDISERRRALQALKESEEKFRSLFENITEGVALHELIYENNHPVNYRIIDANPAFNRYTGIDLEKAIGALATDLYDDLPYFKEYSQVATAGEPFKFESFYPAMKKHFVINVISPKKGQFATVFEDITDQKRIEQEMKHRNEELTRFIYTVSHDLKSPLVTIKMFTSYLKDDLKNHDTASQEKDLMYINNATDKMGRLLNELLELSRIGRKEDPVSEVFLDTIIKSTTDLVAGRIRQNNVKILVTAPPIILSGYIQRFIQLYQNLIDNAIKFMGNQPEPVVEIGAYKDNEGELVLFVRDNGSGIDIRYQHKLFGLFEKLNPESEGTGIGLALVKRIVEVHGGRIWFTSEGLNKGTTFYFTLKNSRIMHQI